MLSSLVLSLALSAQTPGPPAPPPPPRLRLEDYLPPVTDANRPDGQALAFLRSNGEDDLPVTPPQVEIAAGEDMSRTAFSVAFNWVWLTGAGERRPVWFARLRAMTWTGAVERFADSRTCPGLDESLDRLGALPPVELRVPRPPDPGAPVDLGDLGGAYMHDNSYRVRLRGMFAGGAYAQRVEVSGGSDAPLVPLIADVMTRLKPCWSGTAPPAA